MSGKGNVYLQLDLMREVDGDGRERNGNVRYRRYRQKRVIENGTGQRPMLEVHKWSNAEKQQGNVKKKKTKEDEDDDTPTINGIND